MVQTLLLLMLVPVAGVEALESAVPPPDLAADALEFRGDTGEFVAQGHAHVAREGMHLEGDLIRYNRETGDIAAEGHAVYRDDTILLSAEFIRVNQTTRLGEATGGVEIRYLPEEVIVRGERLERLSEEHYRLSDCSVTSCEGDSPAWDFMASRLDFHYGRSIQGSHVRFHVKSVPVLYAPFFYWPALVRRQSGFLIPEIGTSNTLGGIARLRYYWMMSVNRDATFQADLYSKKGIGKGLEYRYLESRETRGEAWVYHLLDDETGRDYIEARVYHDQKLPLDIRLGLDANWISREDFYREFETSRSQRIQRYLPSTGFLSRQGENLRLFSTARYIQDLSQDAKDVSSTFEAGGRYFAVKGTVLPVFLEMNVSGKSLQPDTGPSVERAYVAPSVSTSIRIPGFTLNPSLEASRAFYQISDWTRESVTRDTFLSNTTLATKLLRAYGPYRHYIEPELGYYLRTSSGDRVPELDALDQQEDSRKATASLVNRLYRGGHERVMLGISESYRFDRTDRPWENVTAELVVNLGLSLTGTAEYDPYGGVLAAYTADARYDLHESYVKLGRRFARDDTDVYSAEALLRPADALQLRGEAWYDDIEDELQELRLEVTYLFQCWGMTLAMVERPDETRFMANIALKGVGPFGFR